MKILCAICQDLLTQSEDTFFTRCGHVFHHRCLFQWLERSKTCPQCRTEATVDRIHKAHFTFSNPESADNVDNSTLQGRIDSLQFQILLNEKNIKHYTSKNVILEKQNAGLRQEVRKVESQINQKTAIIYDIKKERDRLRYNCIFLEKKLFKKKKEVEQFRNMCKTLSTNMLEDVPKMVRKVTDRNTLIHYISVMKKLVLKKRKKIENLQNELTRNQEFSGEKSFKDIESELKLAFYKNENLSLQHRVIELKKLLKIMSDQNYVTKSSSRRNSNENSITVQTETADQSDSSTEVEIVDDTDQENCMNSDSTIEECPTVRKKARVCLRSGNSSDKTNYVIINDVKNTQK